MTPAALRRRCLPVLLGMLLAAPAGADWRLEQPRGGSPRATVGEAKGDRVALYRDGDAVKLDFHIRAGFSGLAETHCPTFQVDALTPLFHAAVGPACKVTADHAQIEIARVSGQRLRSRPVDNLLNGEQVAFRYLTTAGTYRETTFSLKRSARAIRAAIGRNVRISAD